MVFTATAPPKAQQLIIKNLNLRNPQIISINPERPNIKYSNIMRPPSSQTEEHLEEILIPIMEGLATEKQNYPLTIMYTDTSVISFCYAYLEKNLGNRQYIGDPIPENRIFAQYHQTYTEKMKFFIVQEICKSNSRIRFVMCTVTLGMGLNALHVRRIIHYKPPTMIERYFQETGRAGRDGEPSYATLYYNNTDIRSNRPGIDKAIVKYCKNTSSCKRAVMLECFGFQPIQGNQNCCDFCDSNHGQKPPSAWILKWDICHLRILPRVNPVQYETVLQ